MAIKDPYPGTPKWVKAFAVAAIIILVIIVVLMILVGGEHGPQRHLREAPAVAPAADEAARKPNSLEAAYGRGSGGNG